MNLTERIAQHVVEIEASKINSETLEQTKLHILDTIGSSLVGLRSNHGRSLVEFSKSIDANFEGKSSDFERIFELCSVTRSTEMDDIHLESCTTPGSVVIPTALLVSSRENIQSNVFIGAVIAGYDVITRLGSALSGPYVLYKGIWPTLLCATIGASSVAAKILNLDTRKTANALAIAASLSCISNPPARGKSTRQLVMGLSCRNGVYAAIASNQGFTGDIGILEGSWAERIVGKSGINESILLRGLDRTFQIVNTSFKLYTCAKQQASTVDAFGEILSKGIKTSAIDSIRVYVPKYYRHMIDVTKRNEKTSVIEKPSPLNIGYRLALLACHPAGLSARDEDVLLTPEMSTLIKKVSVFTDNKLERYYPKTWPARVQVKANGRIHEKRVLHASGDPKGKIKVTKEMIIEKYHKSFADSQDATRFDEIARLVASLPDQQAFTSLLSDVTELWKILVVGPANNSDTE